MKLHLLIKNLFLTTSAMGFIMLFSTQLTGQVQKDDPNLDQIPQWYYDNPGNQTRVASQVITIDGYDNYYLGVDFAEGHNSVNPLEPTEFFAAFNISKAHRTDDGHDWEFTQPNWGGNTNGDPVTAYDADGNLYYEIMYGGVTGCKVARSSDNGKTWDFVKVAISGFDKNWIAADQTDGPYSNYVYTTMTGGGGGNFARSTDQGESWTTTWNASTQSSDRATTSLALLTPFCL